MKAMLFAAGLGTRLKPFTDSNPKALALVNNKTLLEHNIRYLQRYGIYDVVVNVHHFADKIAATLKEHNNFGSNITLSDERDEILETGGGLKKAAPFFAGEETFVVLNVDALTNLDLNTVIRAHTASGAIGTLAVMQRPSGRHLLFDKDMTLCGWQNNTTNEQRISRNTAPLLPFAFSGVQVLSQFVLQNIPFTGKFSLIDLYLHLAKNNTIKGYDHTGDIFVDVGKPESIAKAEDLLN
jgi:MurNAc alpha-1-phosphate uridylyltransferase